MVTKDLLNYLENMSYIDKTIVDVNILGEIIKLKKTQEVFFTFEFF